MAEAVGWASNTVLSFLKDVEGLPILWDPKNPQYKMVKRRSDIWSQLAKKYNCPLDELKKRWQVMEVTFKREKTKEALSSGQYKSQWFAYTHMSFIGERYKPRILQPVVEKCDAVQGNDKRKATNEPDQESSEEDSSDDEDDSDEDDDDDDDDEEEEEEEEEEGDGNDNDNGNGNGNDAAQLVQQKHPTVVSVNPEPRTYVLSSANNVQCAKRTRIETPERAGVENILTRPIHVFTRSTQSDFSERNEYSIFGEYVAKKLMKMDDKLCSIVQHEIQGILFKAEMGVYNNCSFTFEVNNRAYSDAGSSPQNPTPTSTSHPHVGYKSSP